MTKLSDDILNKYIDGELDENTVANIRTIIKESEEDRDRLNTMLKLHNNLKKIKEYEVPSNFTSLILQKIKETTNIKKTDKRFIVMISSILLLFSLVVVGYSFYLIMPTVSSSADINTNIDQYTNYFSKLLNSFIKFFDARNISIIGSVFSLGLLISGYLFFEFHRSSKRRLGKFN